MAKRTLDIGKALDQELSVVLEAIQAAAVFASLGERLGKVPSDVDLPPGSTVIEFRRVEPGEDPDSLRGLPKEVIAQFPSYCTRYSVVAMVTACEVYL